VLDLTDDKGAYCGLLLGNLGADVIKIEKPGGDSMRSIGPFYKDMPDPEQSFYWMGYNANKRGVTLNLETTDGREIFKRMVKQADIVLESFATGYLDGLGISYSTLEKLNPKLIMASISPFGQSGPYRDIKVSDLVAWAMSGLLFVTGDPDKPPVRVSHIPLAYLLASMDAALAAAISIFWRGSSGEGQYIDVSIQESACKTAWMARERWAVTGKEYERGSSLYNVPYTPIQLHLVWPVKDGFVMYMIYVGAFGEAEDKRLMRWLEDVGLADAYIRAIDWGQLDWRTKTLEDSEKIQGYFGRLFKMYTKDELVAEAMKRGVMIQPVSSPRDILSHQQLIARDYYQGVKYPELDLTLNYPTRFCITSETASKIWRRAPRIGEHNQEIFGQELGFSAEELVSLKEGGII